MLEKELVKLCKSRKGQKKAYDFFLPAMSRICFRYLPDESEVFEALTNGFFNVFNKINSFKYLGEGSLDAWIRKIMVNECLMLLRKKKRLHHMTALEEIQDIPDISYLEIDNEYLYLAIKKLPDGCRTIFNMNVIEGYAHREIAEELKISESASRSQLTYAKKKLRELLTPYFK